MKEIEMKDTEIIQGLSISLNTEHIDDLLSLDKGVAVVPIRGCTQELLSRLTELSRGLPWVKVAQNTSTEVIQNFKSCSEFAEESLWHMLSVVIQTQLQKNFEEKLLDGLLAIPLSFTDLTVHHYHQSKEGESFGISPHRDQSGFINLVVVLLISGPSAFNICKDKKGTNTFEIKAQPGDLILMRGGEFGGDLPRPHHFVGRIEDSNGRMSFCLRQLTSDPEKAGKIKKFFSEILQE